MSARRKIIKRHALILVFEYKAVPSAIDVPGPLLSMDTDLSLAFDLAKRRFQIPTGNITVVTDIKPKKGVMNPWDPMVHDVEKNPRIVRLAHPDIGKICREIAQFVENTVRGVREDVTGKGEQTLHEVFIYISGHGAQIPNPCRNHDDEPEMDNALIFTTPDGRTRRYLRDDHIFRILFGQMDVTDEGYMSIPITSRHLEKTSEGTPYFRFDDEVITFHLTPGITDRLRPVGWYEDVGDAKIVAESPHSRIRYIGDRGLPSTAHMLVVIDTCHSGKMTDFHWKYNPHRQCMELTRKPPSSRVSFPLCICLAAANDEEDAPSTSNGSTFTRHLHFIFNRLRGTVSIMEIHALIYSQIPKLLAKCKPTITATTDNEENLLPLLGASSHELPLPDEEEVETYPTVRVPRRQGDTYVGRLITSYENKGASSASSPQAKPT
ncbi:Hypothetical protein POVN_LOCUS634 [uncultured virus]|nr:Hypothetical protein POVN_LOCUS634 [uncultured virus]